MTHPVIRADRLSICPIGPDAAARLQAVYEAAPDYFAAITGAAGPEPDTALQELRQARAQEGRVAALLTLPDGSDVGAVGWWAGHPSPEVALFGMMVVIPERRGQGLAREALAALEGHLAAAGIAQLRTAIPYRRLHGVLPILRALGFAEMSIAEHTKLGVGGAGVALWAKAIG